MGTTVKSVLCERGKQLILWETVSNSHNQGKVTLLGHLMELQGNGNDCSCENIKRVEVSCSFLLPLLLLPHIPTLEYAKHI